MYVAPVCFLSLLQYYIALALTSVSSTIILNNFTSIATLILSIIFLHKKLEWGIALATLVSFLSITVIALSDSNSGSGDTIYGDIIALTGAITYAIFSIQIYHLFGGQNDVSYLTVLGLIGVYTLLIGWIPVLTAHYLHIEIFELPDLHTFGYLCLNVLFGTISYEYFNGKAIFYLGPVVCDISLCLVIPISLLVNMFWTGPQSWTYYIGALGVLHAVIGVHLIEYYKKREAEQNVVINETLVDN